MVVRDILHADNTKIKRGVVFVSYRTNLGRLCTGGLIGPRTPWTPCLQPVGELFIMDQARLKVRFKPFIHYPPGRKPGIQARSVGPVGPPVVQHFFHYPCRAAG